jgi:hypothetical protein
MSGLLTLIEHAFDTPIDVLIAAIVAAIAGITRCIIKHPQGFAVVIAIFGPKRFAARALEIVKLRG